MEFAAFVILEALVADPTPRTATELARRLPYSRATVSTLLANYDGVFFVSVHDYSAAPFPAEVRYRARTVQDQQAAELAKVLAGL